LPKLPKVYAIVDTTTLACLDADPVASAQAMLDGGVRLLQFRHKGHFTREAYAQAKQIAGLCAGSKATFVIDDRADIASLLDAGVHLGQDDLPPTDARLIMKPDGFIGFSTHNAQQLQAGDLEPVDYLAIGPVFATSSKANPDPVIGFDAIASLRRLTSKPLVAIGGITLSNAHELWNAGIDSVALISALLPDPARPELIRKRALEWVRASGDML
jgi:thiamine-phosphate pyrophosphorylase